MWHIFVPDMAMSVSLCELSWMPTVVWDRVLCDLVLLRLGTATVCVVASVPCRQDRTGFAVHELLPGLNKRDAILDWNFVDGLLNQADRTSFCVGHMGPGAVYAVRWLWTWCFSMTSLLTDATDQAECATLLHVSKSLAMEASHRIWNVGAYRTFQYPT
jgi:hypothetical protein